MDGARQINCLSCPRCNHTGTAIWLLHVRPRRLKDLVEFSEGFRCVDRGEGHEPFFQCAECRGDAFEREPNRPVSEIVNALALAGDRGVPRDAVEPVDLLSEATQIARR